MTRKSRPNEVSYGAKPGIDDTKAVWREFLKNRRREYRNLLVERYAPLVQSAERQTLYHRVTGWRTDGDVVQQYGGQAADIVETRIASEYDR